MLPSPRSLPLLLTLLTLLLAALVAVAVPGAPPLAGAVVAAGLLHRLAVAALRHRSPVVRPAPATS